MSVSCTTFATATSAVLVTTSVPTTELVESVITADPTTSAIATTTTCLGSAVPSGSAGSATCTFSSVITEFTTIPGGVSTTRVPVTRTVQSVLTLPTTLFTTSCTTIQGPGNGNGNNGGQNGNGNGGSGRDSVVSPPPTVITSTSQTTLPNGDVSTVLVTLTSTVPPSTTTVPPTPTLGTSNNQDSKDKVDLGPAIGGALGGFFALLLIALAIWLFIIKRRRRWDDIFDKTLNDTDGAVGLGFHGGSLGSHSHSNSHSGKSRGRFSLGPDLEVEPKPYQYGIVGHGQSQSQSSATGHSNNHGGNKEKEPGAITSRPSTAGSNYPLLGGSGTGHHNAPSNGSSQIHTPTTYSPSVPATVVTSVPASTPSQPPTSDEIEGFFGKRAGSPVSFTEAAPRKLQVINASPPSIYGAQSLHQRMMSDSSEPSSPIGTPRNLSSINFGGDLGQATGADPTKGGEVNLKGRKSSGPGVSTPKSGVLVSEDGPPKLILNL